MPAMQVVYPGTFSPPTYGHAALARTAAAMYDEVIIICSENPEKADPWFTPAACAALWDAYDLPSNVRVLTLEQFRSHRDPHARLVMVRGLRGPMDAQHEQQVMLYNYEHFGVSTYTYIFSEPAFRAVSSSQARALAKFVRLEELAQQVAPLVVTALIEHARQLRTIVLVAGRPGSGKSTFLSMLEAADARNYVITTDQFNATLKPLLERTFPGQDLVELALHREAELTAVLKGPWLDMLQASIAAAPLDAAVFVEIAYGLQPTKQLFRYVGGKVLYFDCQDNATYSQRNRDRGTPQYLPFVERIPSVEEARDIARANRLVLFHVNSSGSLADLEAQARAFNTLLWKPEGKGVDAWLTSSSACS